MECIPATCKSKRKQRHGILHKFLHQRIPRLSLLSKKRLSWVSIFNLRGGYSYHVHHKDFSDPSGTHPVVLLPKVREDQQVLDTGVDTGSMGWTQEFYAKIGCVFLMLLFRDSDPCPLRIHGRIPVYLPTWMDVSYGTCRPICHIYIWILWDERFITMEHHHGTWGISCLELLQTSRSRSKSTPPKTNMEPEHGPYRKMEIPFGNGIIFRFHLSFPGA